MKRSVELLLLKLADGGRVLRIQEPASGPCLEKRLEPPPSVARQKDRWKQVFVAMLERERARRGDALPSLERAGTAFEKSDASRQGREVREEGPFLGDLLRPWRRSAMGSGGPMRGRPASRTARRI